MVQITLVLIGSGGVGKSCLTVQFLHNKFMKDYDPTIEESYRKQVVVDDKACLLDIVDTAGQEEFSTLRDQYLTTGEGFMIVFSITSRASFEDSKALRMRVLRVKGQDKVPIVFIGNKFDLAEYREVDALEAKKMATSFGVQYLETSAKTRLNVDNAFFTLVRAVRDSQGPEKAGGCCVLL